MGKKRHTHPAIHAPTNRWISNVGVDARDESRRVRVEPVVRCVVVAGKTRLGKRGKEDGFVVEEPVGDGWGRRHKVALGEDDSTARRTR